MLSMHGVTLHKSSKGSQMLNVRYREVKEQDIPSIAKIRAAEWGTEEYWTTRITGYLNKELHPQKALSSRIIYVALEADIIGFIAGHLTARYECEGELEWINVISQYRRTGIASQLVHILAKWFIKHEAYKVCVDPGNDLAREFYHKNGATNLNKHWMMWEDIRIVLSNKSS